MRFIAIYVLGVVLSAVLIVPELGIMLQCPRSLGRNSTFWTNIHSPLFTLRTIPEYFSGLLRLYSVDIMGTSEAFKGWGNYMESPVYYCGLWVFILIPQVFKFLSLKLKILFTLSLISILCYQLFIYPMLLLFAFCGYYYRISAFFVCIILLYIGVRALDFIIKKSVIDAGILIMSLFLAISPVIVSFLALNTSGCDILNTNIVKLVVIFLAIYSVIIFSLKFSRIKLCGMILLVLVLSAELAIFSFNTVNKRVTLTPADIKSKSHYFDNTNEAVSYIKKFDPGFYRIDKDYLCFYLNDSLFQGWKGTQSFHEWHPLPTLEFLEILQVYREIDHPCWNFGFGPRFKLNTLVGVKYYLTKNNNNIPYGSNLLKKVEDVYLYENTYYLPLGFVYDIMLP